MWKRLMLVAAVALAVTVTSAAASGRETAKINDLGLGCLYFGGGNATVVAGGKIPDGATSLLSITGTKLTCFRSLAENLGDRVMRTLGRARPSVTAYRTLDGLDEEVGQIEARAGTRPAHAREFEHTPDQLFRRGALGRDFVRERPKNFADAVSLG